MDALAARFEHCCDGVLRQPVDLQVGMELAQLVGDSAASRWAWPSPMGEET